MCTPGIELRSPGLTLRALSHWAIVSSATKCNFYKACEPFLWSYNEALKTMKTEKQAHTSPYVWGSVISFQEPFYEPCPCSTHLEKGGIVRLCWVQTTYTLLNITLLFKQNNKCHGTKENGVWDNDSKALRKTREKQQQRLTWLRYINSQVHPALDHEKDWPLLRDGYLKDAL